MGKRQVVVYLLALAGSGAVFLAGQSGARLDTRTQPPVIADHPVKNSRDSVRSLRVQALSSSRARLDVSRPPPIPPNNLPQNDNPSRRTSPISIPMTFEPAAGEPGSSVAWVGRGKGLTVLLMRDRISVRAGNSGDVAIRFESARKQRAGVESALNAGEKFAWQGEDRLPGESNYLVGNDPKMWRTNVPHFARAHSGGVAPGVGVDVYGNDEGLEYDLRLAPSTDPSSLRLSLTGAHDVRLDRAGNLVMSVGGADLSMKKPVVYEEIATKWRTGRKQRQRVPGAHGPKTHSTWKARKPRSSEVGARKPKHRPTVRPCSSKDAKLPRNSKISRERPCINVMVQGGSAGRPYRKRVEGAYVLEADGSVGFRLGPHDARATLVIDPSLSIAYATFLGGAGKDAATSVGADGSGKIYVGGTATSATTFPEAGISRLGPADGPAVLFIATIDPTLSGAKSLVYLTFIGGSGTQAGGLIAVDSAGDVAITGTTTATDFPVTDATQPTNGLSSGLGNDISVSEVDPTGAKLIFSTLFGGSGAESISGPWGIALDSSGDVYIATVANTAILDSGSTDLPVTTGAFQTIWDGEPSDGFLAIFTPPSTAGGGATLKYCSYLGTNSAGTPGVGGVAVDKSGNAYIAGFVSNSPSGFPAKNAFQANYGGGESDGFLMKISPLGKGTNDLVYATFLGGSGTDQALAVAVDSQNAPDAYVTGTPSQRIFQSMARHHRISRIRTPQLQRTRF